MNKPSRRAVVRTGVWAVPAVTVAAAAPAFATVSGGGCVGEVCLSGQGAGSCKLPGESTHNGSTYFGYRMVLHFTNDSGSDQVVNIDSIDFGKDTDTTITFGGPYTILATSTTANGGQNVVVILQSTNSANTTAVVCFSVEGSGSACTTVTFASFKPCKCKQNDADPTDPNADCS